MQELSNEETAAVMGKPVTAVEGYSTGRWLRYGVGWQKQRSRCDHDDAHGCLGSGNRTATRRGESIASIVTHYPELTAELGPLLDAAAPVLALSPVPLPDASVLRADRNDFLLEIALLQVEPVSAPVFVRLNSRMVHLLSPLMPKWFSQRGVKWQMGTIAITLTLFFALFAGAVGGVTTHASAGFPRTPFCSVELRT